MRSVHGGTILHKASLTLVREEPSGGGLVGLLHTLLELPEHRFEDLCSMRKLFPIFQKNRY